MLNLHCVLGNDAAVGGAATVSALLRINPRLPIVAMSGHDPDGRLASVYKGAAGALSHQILDVTGAKEDLMAADVRGEIAAGKDKA